jgi:hypothetical protein
LERVEYFIIEFKLHDSILTTAVSADLASFDEMPAIITDDEFPEFDALLFDRAETAGKRNRFDHIGVQL